MKQPYAKVCALVFLSLLLPLSSTYPQTAAVATRHAGPFSYDVTKEVTLNGTVLSVLAKPSQGMIMGSHLLFATSIGQVDASLGTFGLRGKGALSVAPGQQIAVTGVMKTLRNKQVFLARTVKVDGQVYTIRNARGFSVPPHARELASRKATQNREAL